MSHQTAFAGEHLQHVALAVLARKAEVHERSGRHRACTFGCDRAVAVEGVVGVDHPSLAVGRDRNAAAHVGNDQVQVFVTLAYLFGMAACDGFLVQGVEDRNAGAFRNTAQAGDVVQLIDHDRVGDVSLHAGGLGDLLGDQPAEVGGVFALGVHQVVLQGCVYFIYARFDRLDQTAATDHGRERLYVEVVLCECFEYHLLAPVELVDDARETSDLLGRMAQGERQRRLLVVIQGDLRRSRARVDC